MSGATQCVQPRSEPPVGIDGPASLRCRAHRPESHRFANAGCAARCHKRTPVRRRDQGGPSSADWRARTTTLTVAAAGRRCRPIALPDRRLGGKQVWSRHVGADMLFCLPAYAAGVPMVAFVGGRYDGISFRSATLESAMENRRRIVLLPEGPAGNPGGTLPAGLPAAVCLRVIPHWSGRACAGGRQGPVC